MWTHVVDRLILFLIILDQFALSGVGLWLASMAPNASSDHPFYVLYMLTGLCSAFVLFFRGPLSRIMAAVWHAVFVVFVIVNRASLKVGGPSAEVIRYWGLVNTLVVIYLALTAIALLQKRYRLRKTGESVV